MEKKNNSGMLVGILIGIVITLLVVGGLFVTGTIGFKTNTTNNNEQNKSSNTENNEVSNNEVSNNEDSLINNTYIGYFRNDKIAYSTTLVLLDNNEFKICMRTECLEGKYTVDGNKLSLTTNSTEEYPNAMTYIYTLNSDKTGLDSNNMNEYCDLKKISGTNNNSIENTYIGYFRNDKIAYSTTLVLFNNNEFTMCTRYECLNGKYTIDDNKLSLTTDSTEEYPNAITYTYNLNSNKTELTSNNKNEYCDLKKL